MLILKLLSFASLHLVHARWLACTDYIEKNGDYWNPNLCRGFPRDAKRYAGKNQFGVDLGYDHKPSKGIRTCKTRLSSQSYSYHYPKAIYYPGQQVVLVHPMKGHAAASCTNMWIPDFGSKVLRGRMKKDGNRYYKFYEKHVVADLGTSPFGMKNTAPNQYPRRGYQNAPKFCEDPDRSMGTYSFNVPQNISAGSYTFVWSWAFNNPTDIYTTCFDVVITRNKAARDAYLKRRSRFMDISVACGGLVSSGKRGSSVGCEHLNTKAESVTTETVTIIINPKPTKTSAHMSTKTTTPITTRTAQKTSTTATPTATTRKVTTTQKTEPVTTTIRTTTPKATTRKVTTTQKTEPATTTIRTTTPKATTRKVTTTQKTKPVTTATPNATTTTTQKTEAKIFEVMNATSRPQTTEDSTTATTLETRNNYQNKFLPIYGYQLSGVFRIGIPPTRVRRRWLNVNFHCNIGHATFYNAEVIEEVSNGEYKLLQEKPEDVSSGRIEFFIEFEDCNITKKPRVEILYEE